MSTAGLAPSSTTWGNFVNSTYLPFYRRKWKISTKETNEARIRAHLTPRYGARTLASFRRDELQDSLDAKARAGLSYSVVAHLRWDLRQVLRMAVEEEILSRNPAELLFVPRETQRPIRNAALPCGLLADIEDWRVASRKNGPDHWVFPSRTGETPVSRDNMARRHMGPLLNSVGLGWVDFHVMRRTHATLMNEMHDDPKLVADQLGHTLDVNQNVYTRVSLVRRKRAVDALEAAVPSGSSSIEEVLFLR